MAWIKRNLFFTIGGFIALILLGAAGYYIYTSWSYNRDQMQKVTDAYGQLAQDYNSNPSPGNADVDNIKAAQDQIKQLEDWIDKAKTHFQTVTPIPNPAGGVVTDQAFAGTLRKTIQDMQQAATNVNVELPPDYAFSFAAERNLVTFAPGSLGPLSTHLGEVKAICDILFSAKINALVQIQREVVSDNDSTGAQSDYLSDKATTADFGVLGQATITPYSVTFKCFSADLGKVLSNMASSDHCFIVKGINVIPAGAAEMNGQGGMPPPTQALPAATGGLQTILDEKLLQVTLAIEAVKLSKQ
ncbi:MAG TPA: Amuc_1100 family pilus-like protein [Pseudomonadales bacterium]|nr:Amuc_1100 family pilus-like protein [Pseudomonadales bacterium]